MACLILSCVLYKVDYLMAVTAVMKNSLACGKRRQLRYLWPWCYLKVLLGDVVH